MRFVWFYIIGTTLCYIIISIIASSVEEQLRQTNMLSKIKKINTKTVIKISSYLPFLIPFINIILVLIAIFAQEEVLKKVKQKIENENKEN